MKVAIVEDDAVMVLLLEEICRAAGYAIVGTASTASSAVLAIERERPDCLLLDFGLAGQENGLDLLEQARRVHPALFTVMITAWDINDIAGRIGAVQPDRILRKPVRTATLVRILDGAAQRAPGPTPEAAYPADRLA
jgi:DNA-binding NarL/FixJ family response regulator